MDDESPKSGGGDRWGRQDNGDADGASPPRSGEVVDEGVDGAPPGPAGEAWCGRWPRLRHSHGDGGTLLRREGDLESEGESGEGEGVQGGVGDQVGRASG